MVKMCYYTRKGCYLHIFITLIVLRLTFSNMIWHFHALQIFGKWGLMLSKNITIFFYFMSPCPDRVVVFFIYSFYNFSLLKCPLQKQNLNKTMPMFLKFEIFFGVVCFWMLLFKMWFQNSSQNCNKNYSLIVRKIEGTLLCSSLLEMCIQSLKSIV